MSITGNQISSDTGYGEKTRALLFVHDLQCHACLGFLRSFGSRMAEYLEQGAGVFVILPEYDEDKVRLDLPLVSGMDYLIDTNHEVREAYINLIAPGVVSHKAVLFFVLDSYGAPYVCLSADEPSLDAHQSLLNWLQYISIQCPE